MWNQQALWSDPELEGWLEKRGGKYSGWKKRYFVLQSSLLFYFTSEAKDKGPTGVLPLEGSTVTIADEGAAGSKHHFAFVLKLAPNYGELAKRDTYVLAAEKYTVLDEWMQKLTRAADSRAYLVGELQRLRARAGELKALLQRSRSHMALMAAASSASETSKALQAELDRARAELEQYNGVTANAVTQADQQEAAILRAASRCTVLGHYATGGGMAGESPTVNALRMEAQSLEEVLALLQAKVGHMRGEAAETLSGDARRQLQGLVRNALAALQQRPAGARASIGQARNSSAHSSVSSGFGGVFSRAASVGSSVGQRSSGGVSIASIPEGVEEEEAPSGLLAQLQLKSKQMSGHVPQQVGRPSADSFTGMRSPSGSISAQIPVPPAPMAAPQAPRMPQFGAPPIPRNSSNGGWIGGYAKEGFQGVDILRQVAPPPAPASMLRPNLPPTINPASPGASFGIRPVAVNGLNPGFANGPVASPGLNPGFASRPVAVNGFNMASVSSQPVVKPNLVQSPPAPPSMKSGGSLAEQLAARAGSLKSSNAPPPPPPVAAPTLNRAPAPAAKGRGAPPPPPPPMPSPEEAAAFAKGKAAAAAPPPPARPSGHVPTPPASKPGGGVNLADQLRMKVLSRRAADD